MKDNKIFLFFAKMKLNLGKISLRCFNAIERYSITEHELVVPKTYRNIGIKTIREIILLQDEITEKLLKINGMTL